MRVLDSMEGPSAAQCAKELFQSWLWCLIESTSESLLYENPLQPGLPFMWARLKNDERLVLLNRASPESLIIDEWELKLESEAG